MKTASAPITPARQWRTLEERAHLVEHGDEFPAGAAEWPEDELSRRNFLQIMGASLALAASVGCTRQPSEEIVPYVRQQEGVTPGRPLYFATGMELGGEGYGLLVRSDSGRPTKIEGNPDHPATLGRSSVHQQAALLSLYDPARSQTVTHGGVPATWDALLGALNAEAAKWQNNGGATLRLLTRQVGSPTFREQIRQLLEKYPQARWHEHDPAFPRHSKPVNLRLDRAQVVVSFDAELFGNGARQIRQVRDYTQRRNDPEAPSRLYVIESMPSLTGSMADHRRRARPSEIGALATQLLQSLSGERPSEDHWLEALAKDLRQHVGTSLVVAGEYLPPEIHATVWQINELLKNNGVALDYDQGPANDLVPASLVELVGDMRAGQVGSLIILGPNPVYDAPADLAFAEALGKVPFSVHLGLYLDETGRHCHWHLPESHFLETWSDTRTFDGRDSIGQPLIDPLYPSKSPHELLAALLGEAVSDGYEIIHAAWLKRHGGDNPEKAWKKALHDGVSAVTPTDPLANGHDRPFQSASTPTDRPQNRTAGVELIIRPDPFLLDGRFAENAWLQELPRPFTKLTWGNAAHLSPATARQLGLEQGDIIELFYRGCKVQAPVWVLPGHADGCATVHLGHGRAVLGGVTGFNAFALQTSDAPWGGPGLEIRKVGRRHRFASTQEHWRMNGHDLVRVESLGDRRETSRSEAEAVSNESLYPAVNYERPSWGMVIDLNRCIGCAACTIACQAENNIPVVGRDQVLRGREMHWIRVDAYYAGSAEEPQMLHQPVPCMHCENAPCEAVCPVAATVHDHEGLNVMVYNRCVGTRYCSNNCPYKVRRFNFLSFNDTKSPQLALMRNPEVTVRMRGVMEKCTYCTQRISAARITAEKESRPIRDGEVTPACAQACPAEAITFGDILDPESRVTQRRKSPHHYALLAELNTRPRTTYLSRRRNPNPELGET